MDKKTKKTIYEAQESREEKEASAAPVYYPEQEVATLRLIFRLIYLFIYMSIGLIITPIVAYVIFVASLPNFWKSSAKVFKKKKKVKPLDIKLTPEDLGPRDTKEANSEEKKPWEDDQFGIFYPNKWGSG